MRRLALAMSVALLAAGCYHGAAKPGPTDGSSLDFTITQTVVVDDSGIHPDDVRAQAGSAIKVTNGGTRDHDVTSDTIQTGTLHPGESTTVFFTVAGTTKIYDHADPTHTGQIVVSAPA